jgi:murein DD-endopeptidase MepM/ murein hydrolase activator NlpD
VTREARRGAARRTSALAVLVVLGFPLVLGPQAAAAPAPSAQSLEETRQREAAAASELEDSSRVVQEAGMALAEVAHQLPLAEADVARAKGELAGAQAKLTAAREAVARAEAARAEAQAKVTEAGEKVEEGRADLDAIARRAYQRGRLGAIQDVMSAGEPDEILERAGMMRSVFRYQDGTIERLTRDRLSLARTEADLVAEERAVNRAKGVAEEGEARARQITAEAESAAQRVAQLVADREAALAVAEANRVEDERAYQEAQAASAALAERIRRAAAEAAAAEARRQAAERAAREAADRAAREAAARANRPAPPPSAPEAESPRSDRMLWPAPGRLTSSYGYRVHPIFGTRRLHAGIDIGGGMGARVSAAQTGTVILAGAASGYGTLVVISHGGDLTTAYAHMGRITVRVGQRVERGEQVGNIGNEGNSTGPHLHFEVRRDGNPVDPLGYVSPP